ncbi:MAG: sensor histidine kinase [Verrucomicrobiales bacterium]|nr:sensor histidine kinase [Verrucomicrobiales bacterium]
MAQNVPLVFTNAGEALRLGRGSNSISGLAQLSGVVTWVNSAGTAFVLQDETGAARFELPLPNADIGFGQRVRLEGRLAAGRGHVDFVSQPLVEDNPAGQGTMREASGSLRLEPGRNSFRFEFVRAHGQPAPSVFFAGPDEARCRLEPANLSYRTAEGNWAAGAEFRSFRGTWKTLPNFERWLPIATGTATNFDAGTVDSSYDLALEFRGSFEAALAGTFQFWVQAREHYRLYVNEQPVRVVEAGPSALPVPIEIRPGQVITEQEDCRWAEAAGTVSSVGFHAGQAWLELVADGSRLELEVERAQGWDTALLLKSRVRVTGVCSARLNPAGQRVAGAMMVPHPGLVRIEQLPLSAWASFPALSLTNLLASDGPKPGSRVRIRGQVQEAGSIDGIKLGDPTNVIRVRTVGTNLAVKGENVEVLGEVCVLPGGGVELTNAFWRLTGENWPQAWSNNPPLTSIEQIRLLSPEELGRRPWVRVRGVVTCNRTKVLATIQDGTSGISCDFAQLQGEALQPGDYVEVIGFVDRGNFGPTLSGAWAFPLGQAGLPEPLKPGWEQLMNGSLDQQWVEVHGVAQQIEGGTNLTLKIKDGEIAVMMFQSKPDELERLQNSIVRVRGVVGPVCDAQGKIQRGALWVSSPAFVTVEESASAPVSAPLKSILELFRYDPRGANSFFRVRVRGQVVHAGNEESFLMDGTNGLRFIPQQGAKFKVGDTVEVVGFPELGGYSPLIQEAMVQQIAPGELPPAAQIGIPELLAGLHDATRVQVEGIVVNETVIQSDQVLEFQTGQRIIAARLGRQLGRLPSVEVGSRVRLTGVFVSHARRAMSGAGSESFELLLNSPGDLVILASPSWWTVRRGLTLAGVLCGVLLLAFGWIFLLGRRIEERTKQLEHAIRQRELAERRHASEAERARISRDLHDDLGSSLTGISLLASVGVANHSNLDARTAWRLKAIAGKARTLVTALDTIVWAVNPEADGLQVFADYLSAYAQEFITDSGLVCRFKIPMEFPARRVEGRLRHGLLLAVKEALNNAVRHSHANEIEFGVNLEADCLKIEIADNGRGFDVSTAAGGNGLGNMRQRLADLGGECQISSSKATGTIVRLIIPLPANTA